MDVYREHTRNPFRSLTLDKMTDNPEMQSPNLPNAFRLARCVPVEFSEYDYDFDDKVGDRVFGAKYHMELNFDVEKALIEIVFQMTIAVAEDDSETKEDPRVIARGKLKTEYEMLYEAKGSAPYGVPISFLGIFIATAYSNTRGFIIGKTTHRDLYESPPPLINIKELLVNIFGASEGIYVFDIVKEEGEEGDAIFESD